MGNESPGEWLCETIETDPDASMAVGSIQNTGVVPGNEPSSTVAGTVDGMLSTVGGVVSVGMTMTLKVTVVGLPAASWKMYVTGVVPNGKESPGLWDWNTTVTGPDGSIAMGSVQTAGTMAAGSSASFETSPGGLMTVGPVVSTAVTMILKVVVSEIPAASWNMYVTGVVPTGKESPGLCDWNTVVTGKEMSVATGSVQSTDLIVPGSSMVVVMSSGGLITVGGVVSTDTMTTLKVTMVGFPELSWKV